MRIFTAAVESTESTVFSKGVRPKVIRNVFWSYYYSRTEARTKFLVKLRPCVDMVVIDSGAHSFFTEQDTGLAASGQVKRERKEHDPDEYFNIYLNWLKLVYDSFDYFVELDIGELVGQEKVLSWRERIKKLGFWEKCIIVYHPEVVSWKTYIKELDDLPSRYVALEGDRVYRNRINYLPLIKAAYDRGVRVHGFALTKPDVLKAYPFYSVDSTTWKNASRYGRLPIWQDGRLIHLAMKRSGQGAGISDGVMNKLGKEAMEGKPVGGVLPSSSISIMDRFCYCLKVFQAMEDHYTELWKKRGIDWEAQINAHS